MTMTVFRLHKQLSELIAAGHGRKPVCINKRTFNHRMEEDGAVILPVESVSGPEFIGTTDDDGEMKFNRDGTEAGRYTVVLSGGEEE
ncbi:MAG: hypothetical protein BWY57_03291 [Betaproteobacteria bacterium ADurb.Bin341]|nr:MAG: hypothetical protein BWY57_03291 [Betaproteobacteria bacterium ADurb.Bin341]